MKRLTIAIPGLLLFTFGVWLTLAPFKRTVQRSGPLYRCGPAISEWLAPSYGLDTPRCKSPGAKRAAPGIVAGLLGVGLLAASTRLKEAE